MVTEESCGTLCSVPTMEGHKNMKNCKIQERAQLRAATDNY